MKKLLMVFSLLIMSSSCFAIVNFTSSTGTLVMRDVSVDGATVYDSVTMQLNLANGTFTILDATLGDNNFSSTALDTYTEENIKIDFMGCKLSGKNQITCLTRIVCLDKDKLLIAMGKNRFSGNGSKLFDNQSKEYTATTVTALDKSDSENLSFNAIQGIPIDVKFIFNDIDSAATSISVFRPWFAPFNGVSAFTPDIVPYFHDIQF